MGNNSIDIATDLGEALLDSFLNDGLLKDIPALGTVVNLAKASGSIRDRILLRKLLAFRAQTKVLSNEEISTFVIDNLSTDNKASDLGNQLIESIDKNEGVEKAKIIGKLFVAYVLKYIEEEDFSRLCAAINGAYIRDLNALLGVHSGFYAGPYLQYLLPSGLTYSQPGEPSRMPTRPTRIENEIRISSHGHKLINTLIKVDSYAESAEEI